MNYIMNSLDDMLMAWFLWNFSLLKTVSKAELFFKKWKALFNQFLLHKFWIQEEIWGNNTFAILISKTKLMTLSSLPPIFFYDLRSIRSFPSRGHGYLCPDKTSILKFSIRLYFKSLPFDHNLWLIKRKKLILQNSLIFWDSIKWVLHIEVWLVEKNWIMGLFSAEKLENHSYFKNFERVSIALHF